MASPALLVLDNIRSMLNVGSIFRSADAFGARLCLCGITGQPPHREIQKTALGATQTVPWQYTADTQPLIEDLRAQGYTIVCVEQTDNSVPLHTFPFREQDRYAFVLGNELHGLTRQWLDCCNSFVDIPQQGMKKSLNVAVVAGIVLWAYAHYRR